MVKLYFILLLVVFFPFYGMAQSNVVHNQSDFKLNIGKISEKIVLDGKLEEAVWQKNENVAKDFWRKFPLNDIKAAQKTEVKVCFDDQFLYIGATMYQSEKGNLVTSLKRDQGLRNGDGLGIILDPFNQKSNGFLFVVTPFNSQSEDLLNSNNYDIDFSWDNKWFSETKIYDDRWTLEIAIPFNILRYDAANTNWGINFLRSDRKVNEFHSWTLMPQQFRGIDLGYLGLLNWQNAPPKNKTNISVNPYVSSSLDKEVGQETNTKANAGFDAKVAVTNSLNLDLTVNPDFSQVDVDRQVSNLSRFSIFFPERRGFFLENSDLFDYGIPPLKPFYSRRIGSKNGAAAPILFGARLSGSVSNSTRIGIMNITTGRKGDNAGDNFSAASVSQRVLNRSTINAYVLNREGLQNDAEKIADPLGAYGRNLGGEFRYQNKQGNWQGWVGAHHSIKPNISGQNNYVSMGGQYEGQNLNVVVDYGQVGKNFYVDMGFENLIENYDAQRDSTIRLGYNFYYNETKYTWFPKNKNAKWNNISLGAENFYQYTRDGKPYENSNEVKFIYHSKKTSGFDLVWERSTVHLRYPFKFVDEATAAALPAKQYNFSQYEVIYYTDFRKDLTLRTSARVGKFYNADFFQTKISVTARKQPKYSFTLNAELNKLKFPQGFGEEDIVIIAPQFEYNFSNKMFWTTFVQLNSQNNNININSRFQYRFKPMSDLFVVYTDNYTNDPLFKQKNRGIVVKLNYWLNL